MGLKDCKKFVRDSERYIRKKIGNEKAIVALSGGVDSSVVAVLAHKVLGRNLTAIYIDDFFRKKNEYDFVRNIFSGFGMNVKLCDIKNEMLGALERIVDNNQKRPLFKDIFYKTFGEEIKNIQSRYLLQGTIKADKQMLDKGQEQHNVGVDFQKYGIEIIEPLENLYKPDIRKIARFLGLPKEISERQPFPGPGLVIRCLGEINKEKIEIVREAQYIAEKETESLNPFQVVVAISGDKVCSMRDESIPDKYMLFVRVVESEDAMTAKAIIPNPSLKNNIEEKLISISDKVGRILWDTTDKPPATIEYI